MPESLGPFRPKNSSSGDPMRDLRVRLEHIEYHLIRLPGTSSVEVDESGSGGVSFSDGGSPPGGGGGGGSDPSGTNALLDGNQHNDTAVADPVAGDLVYGDTSARWNRFAIGADGKVLGAVAGAPAWIDPPTPSGLAGGSILGAWARDDISNFGTAGDGNELPASWSKGANDMMSVVVPSAGSVTGLTLYLSGDVGGGGDSVTLTLYRNGVSSGMALTLAGGAGTEYKAFVSTGGPVTLAAGDELTVYGKKVNGGGLTTAKCVAYVWGILGV